MSNFNLITPKVGTPTLQKKIQKSSQLLMNRRGKVNLIEEMNDFFLKLETSSFDYPFLSPASRTNYARLYYLPRYG